MGGERGGEKGGWDEKDQEKAAERGQGAEIGGAHGPEGAPDSGKRPAETNRDQPATPESNPS